jgi:microsomal dipeptidase-like Zn-dependent dipeptidase
MAYPNLTIDLHCHPAMKPFGKSFKSKETRGVNSPAVKQKNSLWCYDPPTVTDKLLNYVTGLTKFRQSDMSSLVYGGVRLISASLYPIEKGFVVNKLKDGQFSDAALNLATGLSDERIDHLQKLKSYYKDLEEEYDFYKQLHGREVRVDNRNARYFLLKNYNDLESLVLKAGDADNTVGIFFSIEGAHVLECGMPGTKADEATVLANITKIKQWEYPPFFITVAHHFYNELCGHAKSLSGIMAKTLDQRDKMDTGFTPLGRKVIKALLDTGNGRRILVDIKHMSPLSRREYFQWLDKEYPGNQVPIIVSHGAANGMWAYDNNHSPNLDTAPLLMAATINFYDEEIIRIARSKGIFGLQMDERRIGSQAALAKAKGRLERRKILFHRSKLVWNQVQHIAEVLDKAGEYPWSITAIGTDFDGIIDPLNGYWTAEDLGQLDDYLLMHAQNYMQGRGKQLKHGNTVDAEEIVSRVMYLNALEFLSKNF